MKFARAYAFVFIAGIIITLIAGSGCANIVPPGGGARDSIAPILVAETPMDSAKNVTTRRFTFVFDEFVELQNIQENVLISPTPANTPLVDWKLRTVTVRLRDTLEPNTTYSFNFGNAIKDINEGNVFKNFSYVFSTGNTIDTNTLSGKVVLAETGKIDSTMVAILHRNVDDSAIAKERPRYTARLDGQGNFSFRNIPGGTFRLYALGGFSRTYIDKSSLFAFADSPIVVGAQTRPVNLFAYAEVTRPAPGTGTTPALTREQARVVRFTTNLQGNALDILNPLTINFDRRISNYDTNKIVLTSKEFVRQSNYSIRPDKPASRFIINHNWTPGNDYNLIIARDAFIDSAGATLAKADTISFTAKRETDYGSVKIRFNNLDLSRNPMLLIVQNDAILKTVPLTQRDYIQKLFEPGEYDLRILYDTNKNGRWDAGEFFGRRRQPERVISLNTKLSVRSNWDNEKEITLNP